MNYLIVNQLKEVSNLYEFWKEKLTALSINNKFVNKLETKKKTSIYFTALIKKKTATIIE